MMPQAKNIYRNFSVPFNSFKFVPFLNSFYSVLSMYVWIYENGAEEFESYHPYFTLISLLLKAAFKPCKGQKIKRGQQ